MSNRAYPQEASVPSLSRDAFPFIISWVNTLKYWHHGSFTALFLQLTPLQFPFPQLSYYKSVKRSLYPCEPGNLRPKSKLQPNSHLWNSSLEASLKVTTYKFIRCLMNLVTELYQQVLMVPVALLPQLHLNNQQSGDISANKPGISWKYLILVPCNPAPEWMFLFKKAFSLGNFQTEH